MVSWKFDHVLYVFMKIWSCIIWFHEDLIMYYMVSWRFNHVLFGFMKIWSCILWFHEDLIMYYLVSWRFDGVFPIYCPRPNIGHCVVRCAIQFMQFYFKLQYPNPQLNTAYITWYTFFSIKNWMTTCLRSWDMNAIGDKANLQTSPIAFISHERKQVVNQYLYLHFPTQSM